MQNFIHKSMFLLSALLVFAGGGTDLHAQRRTMDWREVELAEVDTRNLDAAGSVLLKSGKGWRHALTGRLAVHFQRAMFARKVGRMGEFFLEYIAADLRFEADITGVSHILVFEDPEAWERLLESRPEVPSWAGSFALGRVLYLKRGPDTGRSAGTLGHEMAHLAVNTLYPGGLPLWINEGLAEWYETFAWAAFKGTGSSRKAAYRGEAAPYSLEELLDARDYPSDPAAVQDFYAAARQVTGFLRIRGGEELFARWVGDAAQGKDTRLLLAEHYGFQSLEKLREALEKF